MSGGVNDGDWTYSAQMLGSAQNIRGLAKKLHTMVENFEKTNNRNIQGLMGTYTDAYNQAQGRLNQAMTNMANILHSTGDVVEKNHNDANRADRKIAGNLGGGGSRT